MFWMNDDWLKNVNECRKGWNEKLEDMKMNVEFANVMANGEMFVENVEKCRNAERCKKFQDVKLKM